MTPSQTHPAAEPVLGQLGLGAGPQDIPAQVAALAMIQQSQLLGALAVKDAAQGNLRRRACANAFVSNSEGTRGRAQDFMSDWRLNLN